MRIAGLVVWTALGLVAALPAAAAYEGECVTNIDKLCQELDKTQAHKVFGGYADIGFLAVAWVIAVVVSTLLLRVIGVGAARPKLKATVREEVKEVGPGGTVQLLIDAENASPKVSTDVILEFPRLPEGWVAETFAAVTHASGFTQPQVLTRERPVHLSSLEKGSHQATLAVQLSAPTGPTDETVDLPVRVIPVVGGVPRPKWGHEARFTVVLSEKPLAIQIATVTHEPTAITVGQPVLTRAVLHNDADAEARDVGVQFLLNDETVDSKVVPVLPPHEQATVEFQWVPGHGENRIRISVA